MTIILKKSTKKMQKKIFSKFFPKFFLNFFFKKTNFFPSKKNFFCPQKFFFHFFFLSKISLGLPNGAGSLFHGTLVYFIEPAKATGSMISPLFVRPFVRSFVRNELISETAPTIFLKLGMKLGDNKGKKIARPDF